jgi:predicted nucleic acid-binding protein
VIAIDTNVVVRLLTGDDPGQARRARALVEKSDVFLCTSVLLEAEWVLRSAYRFDAPAISAAFRAFLGLPNVSAEAADAVAHALDAYDAGLDFADALHLVSAHAASGFYTFDRRLARAAKVTGVKVEIVP